MIGNRLRLAGWGAYVLPATSGQPSWRKGAGAVRSPSGQGAPNWMEHRPGPSWEGAASRIVALILLAVGVVALLLAWIWLFPDRAPAPLFVLTVVDYQAPYHPNSFAAEDAAVFRRVYADYDNVRVSSAKVAPRTSAEVIGAVESYLAGVRPGGPDKNIVLIYLSALGAVNDEGQPCLVLPSHDPLDAATWLPIAGLLDALAKPEHLQDCQKVLLLDADRIEDAWRMGVVVNTFSLAVEKLIAESPPRNCVVLTSATGLQPSIAAPEISATLFGHYAASGLRGAADEAGDRNQIVTLHELERFLREQVDHWAATRRGVRQQPRILCGGQSDLNLADVSGTAQIPQKPWRVAVEPERFRGLFDRLRQCEQSRAFELDPTNWAKAQFLLERLDAESLAGLAYQNAAEATLLDLDSTLNQLEAQRPFPEVETISLAVKQRLAGDGPSESLEAVWNAWLKEPEKTEPPQDYDRAAAFVWTKLMSGDQPLTRDELAQGLAFCAKSGQPSRDEPAEVAFLRLLERHVDWSSPAMANAATRPLLAARHESELLAATADPRPQFAFARRLQPLDESLGVAFDQTLVGDDESLHLAQQRLDALLGDGSGSYRQVQTFADLVLRSLKVRDEALATALHLNQWLVRRAKHEPAYRADLDGQPVVRGAIALAQCLDDLMLASTDGEAAANQRKLPVLADSLEASVERLKNAYAERIAEITIQERGSPATTSVETPHLLACPLGLGDGRRQLHEAWIAKLSHGAGAPLRGKPPGSKTRGEDDAEYLKWLLTQGTRPLGELLEAEALQADGRTDGDRPSARTVQPDASTQDLALAIAELGGRLRRRLRAMPEDCRTFCDQSASMLADRPAREARMGFSRADALTRAMAPLAYDRAWFASDAAPAALLRTLDAQAWLVWQGRRVVDDCWGAWEPVATSTKPYFETVAAHVADDAERILPDSKHDVAELRQRLDKTVDTIARWRPLVAEDLAVAATGETYVSHRVKFQGEPACSSGQAAVFLTDDNRQLLPTYSPQSLEVRRVGVGTHDSATLENLLRPDTIAAFPVLYANALFRGHVWQTPFSIGQGSSVAWQKPVPSPASVVVRGDSKQISQVIFIVDCSNSMDDGGWDRLKDGRECLRTILNQLIDREEQFQVGLIFYGRRAGWEKLAEGKFEPSWLNKAVWNGAPAADVEIASPLKPLHKDYAAEILELMERAKPWGETPLYRSLTIALQQFDRDIDASRHLIAITDGVDKVASDSRFPIPKTTSRDVIDTLAQFPARIDVIEFGAAETPAHKTLRMIATSQHSGGSFHLAKDADALSELLEDSLRLDRYRLQTTNGDGGAETPWGELGSPTPLPPTVAATPYRVRLQTHQPQPAEIQIEGGEALEILYRRPPENSLVHPVYEDEDDREQQTAGGFLASSLVPTLRLGEPVFRVSIQSGDERQFSRRPEVIWAKVEPLGTESPRSYYFFDREFEPDVPVPMLSLRAQGWPGGKLARVEVGFTMDAGALQPRLIAIPSIGEGDYQAHDARLQVKSEIVDQNMLQVVVIEQHSPESKDYPLHIQLDPTPDSLSRTFFETNRSVHHMFRYSVQPANPKLRVLTRGEIEAGGAGVTFDRVELPRR